MADVHDKNTRSYNMSKITSKDTKPELIVRKYLHNRGFRYRLHDAMLPGKPDIVLKKYQSVILVNGCFWHAHKNCKYFKIPETRSEWWKNKLKNNRERDKINISKLRDMSWNVIIVWECEIKSELNQTLRKVENELIRNYERTE